MIQYQLGMLATCDAIVVLNVTSELQLIQRSVVRATRSTKTIPIATATAAATTKTTANKKVRLTCL